jgi:predicted O-methyltransferase YrrM
METLPEIDQSYKLIFDMCSWPAREKVLAGAIKLGIFNVLNEPVTADEAAGVLGTHPRNTGLFLDALTAIDLVEKKDGRYQNVPVSRTFLVENSPTCMSSVFDYMLTYETFTVDKLLDLVKKGPDSLDNAHTASDEMTEEEVASHAAFERAGKAQLIAKIAASLPEFKSCKKMLDLGCGPGLNGIAIVSAHPTMKGVSFDRPRTVEVAKEMIHRYGMEDRMEVIGGNYAEDPIGEEYDLILASDTLYYTGEEIDPIMTKLHDALNPGGVMITIHPCLMSERTKPGSLVLGSLFSGLKGEDMGLLDQGFLTDAMLRAGFRSVRSKTVDTDWGEEDLDIGRKGGSCQ